MPVMEERRGDDPFQRTEPQIHVGVDEQALDALQREIGDDGRNAEAEDQDRQRRRRPGDDHVDGVTAIRRQPVELRGRMVDTVKSPQHRDLVAHSMAPVPADLGDQQGLCPAEPPGLLREVRRHHGGHCVAGDRKHDGQHGTEAERGEYLVHDESRRVGGRTRPTQRRPLRAKGPPALDEHERNAEQQERCRDVGPSPTRPDQQASGDQCRPAQQTHAVCRRPHPAQDLRMAHRDRADRPVPIMDE